MEWCKHAKIFNNPETVIDDMLEGYLKALSVLVGRTDY